MYDVRGCTAHGLGADSTLSKTPAVTRCGEGASGVLRWIPLVRMVCGCAALICARQFLSRATSARGNAAQGTSLPTEESNVLELLWTSRVVRGCAARICASQLLFPPSGLFPSSGLRVHSRLWLYVVILSRHGVTKSRGSCTRCEVRYFILLQRAVLHRRKHVSEWYHIADRWRGLQGTVI